MRNNMFPFLATATFAIAGLAATLTPAKAADVVVTTQPRHVQYDYAPADRYYSRRTVEIYDEPAEVYYEAPAPYYAPPPVAYSRPVPPAPIVTEYEYGYAPRGYYRGYAPPPRAVEVLDAY
jgi:hypothetical protein